ncbi:pyoverdine chromophore biosynthetic protein PvcB [Longispora fulva]|uniref:Alpha-ketoglutarate-dependent taurine dioxygenase n=1 Tax=Longispora fulva TaxID=619741 RepID=A0A8J7KIT2_9ACTN|nr:TauD/TfdA family dioxygenase [Longispora fulva]MBG6134676.1 alpha-ketoglutarate-dependent taurine dioxygenase [Longispora fulva]GIG61884.1 pyoverdine chromophore biosynthetic protein PvcB [Longispora fulva]
MTTAFTTTTLSPFGQVVQADGPDPDLRALSPEALAERARTHKVLVLRGFPLLSIPDLVDYCRGWGEILEWDFGPVLDLVIHDEPRNYLFARGDVPFHWDGAFAAHVPSFFLFQCVQAPPPGSGGETVFCDTTAVLREAGDDRVKQWDQLTVTYRTDKLAHYGGHRVQPLVDSHPRTGERTLRYAEPLPEGDYLNPLFLEIETLDDAERERFCAEFAEYVHQPRFCYAHEWRDGDIVIADNHALIHGRNAFGTDAPRHLQRIQMI